MMPSMPLALCKVCGAVVLRHMAATIFAERDGVRTDEGKMCKKCTADMARVVEEIDQKANGKVTKKEWRDAVQKFKWDMYMATSCDQGSAWTAHKALLEFLSKNPRLRQSKYGQRYITATASIEMLFDAAANIEGAIENTLADAFGGNLKYWSDRVE